MIKDLSYQRQVRYLDVCLVCSTFTGTSTFHGQTKPRIISRKEKNINATRAVYYNHGEDWSLDREDLEVKVEMERGSL